MGLGDPDLPEDGGGGGGGGTVAAIGAVSCSICLEFVVVGGGDRSTARLQCGHEFHLDCIGSAFNAKGTMQCPNCRKIEKGSWLYSNGYRSMPDLMEEWMPDEDVYDVAYSEMPFGVHFCPFSRLARFPLQYEEGEYALSIGHSELLGQALFAEYPGAVDGQNFHNPWSNIQGPHDIQNSHNFPAPDIHPQTWDSHIQPTNHASGVEQSSASSASRTARLGSDAHSRQMYVPLLVGQGSTSRANGSTTTMVPHYYGNSRGHSRHEGHGSHPHMRGVTPNYFPDARRFGNSRGLAPIGPTPPTEHPSFYFVSPVAPSTRAPQETEVSGGNNLYAWERDRLAPFPLLPVERDCPWWGTVPQTTAPQDSGSRTGTFWPRHGSERPSSQPPVPHHPRLHPFL